METNLSLNRLESYWGLLKNLSVDMKLRLIAKLSASLVSEEEKMADASLADKFYGAWKDDKSAEELIDEVRNSRVLGTRQIESF